MLPGKESDRGAVERRYGPWQPDLEIAARNVLDGRVFELRLFDRLTLRRDLENEGLAGALDEVVAVVSRQRSEVRLDAIDRAQESAYVRGLWVEFAIRGDRVQVQAPGWVGS